MQKLQKHRLALLLGMLVALIFFYLGVNTWMESQESEVAPPPVVRIKPPVQIKPATEPVKPQTPKPVEKPTKQITKTPKKVEEPKPVRKLTESKQKSEIKNPVQKPVQKKEVKNVAQAPKPQTKKPLEKKTVEKQPKPQQKKVEKQKPKQVAKKTTGKSVTKHVKEYVVQIGAFKVKSNADKSLNLAKGKGYEAFIIEEDGLYKVRVRVRAENLKTALRSVRKNFRNAFVVR